MGSVCVWKPWNIEHQVHSHTDTHDVSSPSAPPAASDATAPPEDNDQARKTAEHGEQWGGGVDAVDPGDPARSGGAANRLNTRRNSQSKCGARRRQAQQPRGTEDSAEHRRSRPGHAPDRIRSSARAVHVPHRLPAPRPRLLAARGRPRPPPQPTPPTGCRPQARRSKVRPRCDWPGSARLELVGAIEQPHVGVKAPGSAPDTAQPLLAL